jgi:hypothetical protein
MALFNAILVLALLIVVFQGYKWYRIQRFMSNRDATLPPSLTVWPRSILLILFGVISVWGLVEWLSHRAP